jgi:hypothetical protein
LSLASLRLDAEEIVTWFTVESTDPFIVARMAAEDAAQLPGRIANAVRLCYVDDAALTARATETGQPLLDLVAAKLPDAGSTMAGDFGEILGYAYLAASKHPAVAEGPLKWRLKQDRTKPVPQSDVLLYVLPSWPTASEQDLLMCAEVKTKSTPGHSTPIPDALRDSEKDRTSRLARTLQWLRERSLHENIDGIDLAVLDRFGHASDYPPAIKEFIALAVLSDALAAAELAALPADVPRESRLVVLVVSDLAATYSLVFAAAATALPPAPRAGDAPS